MVVALSYVIAVILTAALAISLYPLSAMFWVFGLLGKLSDGMFSFTKKTIAALWRDLKSSERATMAQATALIDNTEAWVCKCGCRNTGKFCSQCGGSKPDEYVSVE